jgi:predicted Zn-dependent peptidase
MANRHFDAVVYESPYATHPTESVESGRADVAAFHKKNYVANNAAHVRRGRREAGDVKKDVNKHFGLWASGHAG